jgi:hypothetical protein
MIGRALTEISEDADDSSGNQDAVRETDAGTRQQKAS